MNVLQVGPVPKRVGGKNTGGVANHLWDLSTNLVANGYEVNVLAHNLYDSTCNPTTKDGVRIYGVDWKRTVTNTDTYRSAGDLLSVNREYFGQFPPVDRIKYLVYHLHCRSVFERIDPDLIHNHHLGFKCPIVHHERNVTLDGEVPILTSVHGFHGMMFGDEKSKADHETLIRDSYALSDNLLLNSSQVLDEANHLFSDLDKKEYYVGINGVDGEKYHPTGKPLDTTDQTTLLYVSRLEERKGIFTLLDALSDGFSPENVRCIVVGDGEEKPEVERRIETNRIEDVVELKGFVPKLVDYYNEADVLVVPSYHEDFGLIYAEALSCGTPVIATTNVPESLIPNEEIGLRIPPNDSDRLVDAIETASHKEWNTAKILDHARTYHWRNKIADYNEIYTDLVAVDG
ncbi:glycosyltransferase family 4 protein [Haladaptatus caseinilyticus]|uniref:glycosyltransferase family 4 protein n=1 Tax=Haladaptatus caseinilyticus TaxID=2993314 RepID=UPI00224B1C7F|nr:glycosyltransferase family 4 protein [Haladaptatus caseinilyticus]